VATRNPRPKRNREREVDLPEAWKLSDAWPFPSRVEIEQRFEELIRGRWSVVTGEMPVDVYLYGRDVLVELDLPGVERESVRIRLEQGELFVEAHRPPSPLDEGAQPARLERKRGPIRRCVSLPRPVEGRVEFDLESGVLRVRVRPENDE
jgi:HSP20 family molecular chaperone IbpA